MKNSIKKFKNTRIVDKSTILKAIEENNSTEPLINTGSRNIDNILDGGFKPGNTYIIYGPNSSGKTQFCHQLCIQAYIRNIQSIYLDTENTFRPERIRGRTQPGGMSSRILEDPEIAPTTMRLRKNYLHQILMFS